MRRVELVLAACLLTACGTGVEEDEATTATSTPTTTSTTVRESETTSPTGEEPEMGLIEEAIADLSTRLGVLPDDIEPVSVESGVWSDGGLGCPEPDQLYTQALVPGHRVVLEHDGQAYSYHQGGSQPPFLCEDPVENAFTGAEGDVLIPPPGYDE